MVANQIAVAMDDAVRPACDCFWTSPIRSPGWSCATCFAKLKQVSGSLAIRQRRGGLPDRKMANYAVMLEIMTV